MMQINQNNLFLRQPYAMQKLVSFNDNFNYSTSLGSALDLQGISGIVPNYAFQGAVLRINKWLEFNQLNTVSTGFVLACSGRLLTTHDPLQDFGFSFADSVACTEGYAVPAFPVPLNPSKDYQVGAYFFFNQTNCPVGNFLCMVLEQGSGLYYRFRIERQVDGYYFSIYRGATLQLGSVKICGLAGPAPITDGKPFRMAANVHNRNCTISIANTDPASAGQIFTSAPFVMIAANNARNIMGFGFGDTFSHTFGFQAMCCQRFYYYGTSI